MDMEQFEWERETEDLSPKKRCTGRRRIRWVLLWLLSLVLVAGLVSLLFLPLLDDGSLAVAQALRLVREHFYFYEEENDRLLDGALKGVADSLEDDYAYYYTQEEYAELTQTNSGTYIGIGISVLQKDVGVFLIEQVYPDTPAEEAGIRPGDQLQAINGTVAEGYALTDFLDLLDTTDGASSTLVLIRDGRSYETTVTAREIYTPYVVFRMQEPGIGYLHLSGFHGKCVQETVDALHALLEDGMQALVLDLRDNPGGSLYDACDIAGLFLEKNAVITTLRSRTEQTESFRSDRQPILVGENAVPIVVLVNEYSASASELMTAALQDYGVATVIGVQTFGKGIVQSYFPIPETGGYIKMTTEAYYTPNGVCLQGTGITPDIAVEQSAEGNEWYAPDCPYEWDLQLQAAVRYLSE